MKNEHDTTVTLCDHSTAALDYLQATTGVAKSRLIRVLLLAAGSGEIHVPGLPKVNGDKVVADRWREVRRDGVGTA